MENNTKNETGESGRDIVASNGLKTDTSDPHPKHRTKGSAPSDAGFFRAVLSYYCHQNQLMWSRVQIFIAVQGAVISGSYYIAPKSTVAASILLIIGFVLGLFLLFMFLRDGQIRDYNKKTFFRTGQMP